MLILSIRGSWILYKHKLMTLMNRKWFVLLMTQLTRHHLLKSSKSCNPSALPLSTKQQLSSLFIFPNLLMIFTCDLSYLCLHKIRSALLPRGVGVNVWATRLIPFLIPFHKMTTSEHSRHSVVGSSMTFSNNVWSFVWCHNHNRFRKGCKWHAGTISHSTNFAMLVDAARTPTDDFQSLPKWRIEGGVHKKIQHAINEQSFWK